ncbi:MAG TPA: pyridoxal phosphate-dependent aminotransferase [Clostridia bacterium]|nr:pyridoxal phosphate-dependent aminotransferase [Clostridia bacterium]
MISQKMTELGKKRSTIREIFEYGKIRKSEIGEKNVFDFSIGNPSVEAPQCVNQELKRILTETESVKLHGYTSAQGDYVTRKAIADFVNKKENASLDPNLIYMSVGAAAALSICFHAITLPEDEIIVFAPYFAEYKVFIEGANAKFVVSPTDNINLLPNYEIFKTKITKHTKAVVINSPNNPSGVVYKEDVIKKLAEILDEKQNEYGHPIYIISDEPYRELVYDGIKVPFITNYYQNSLVCYSFSKVLSLPGERIGYIAVNPKMPEATDMYAAICGAGRSLGYICAPSIFQKLLPSVLGETSDLSIYKENRDILYKSLTEYGFRCVHPDGAFYLYMQTPEPDSIAFAEKAKKYEILMVPADDFGSKGYVRIAYCVTTEQVKDSLPYFKKLAQEYGLTK